MSHDCPECGELCFCGGDIDDCCLDEDAAVNACTHCLGKEEFDPCEGCIAESCGDCDYYGGNQ